MSERFCIDVGDDPGREPHRSHLARAADEIGYRDLDHYDRDQDLRAEGGEPKPFVTSQRDMVVAAELATHHPDVYARRRQLPHAPQPGAPMAAAVSPDPRAGGPSSPNGRRAHHAAPGGSPSTNATPAVQG